MPRTFKPIAILWSSGDTRCTLSGDGVRLALTIQQNGQTIRHQPVPDEGKALATSLVWYALNASD